MARLSRDRVARMAVGAVVVLTACSGGGSSSTATSTNGTATAPRVVSGLPVGVGNSQATATGKVSYTPSTVVVDLATVRRTLTSVSSDGSTFTFASDSGPLGQLAPGKVMLLYGVDVAKVTKVSHDGNSLVVTTTPAALTDVVQTGNLRVDGPPGFANGFGASSDAAAAVRTTAARVPPAVPPVMLVVDQTVPGAPTTPGIAMSGALGGLSYSVGMNRLPSGVSVVGSLCYEPKYQPGAGSSASKELRTPTNLLSTCRNGMPFLAVSVTTSGTFTWSHQSADLSVANGAASGSLAFENMDGDLKIEYIISRGIGSGTSANPPTFKLPLALEFPVCPPPGFCFGIPLYTKVELALSVTAAAPAKNTIMGGGVELHFGGSPGVDLSGTRVTTTGSGFKIAGSFIPPPVTSLAFGGSAASIALQLKLGLGLGTRGFNLMAYVSAIGSVGQTTGAAVAGQLCTQYLTRGFITANAEAQLTLLNSIFSHLAPSLSVSTPAKTLYAYPVAGPAKTTKGNCYVGLAP